MKMTDKTSKYYTKININGDIKKTSAFLVNAKLQPFYYRNFTISKDEIGTFVSLNNS